MVAVGPGHGAMIKPMAPSPYWGEEKIWDSKANNLGFYAKGFDGRIDAPNAGWKGRGLWTTSDDRAPWLMEGGKGKKPIVVHFQLRPEPLAR
jgi:hypothetical protein